MSRDSRLLRTRLEQALRRHWLFLALLVSGLGFRVLTSLAYRPALLNSTEYVTASADLEPDLIHPAGYPAFLRLLPLGWGLAVVPAVQHLLGLATAVLLYTLLLRLGVRRWLGALAAAPVLLDAYQLNIEQHVSPEALVGLLLVAASALLLWHRPTGHLAAGLAGLLLAAATLTRSIALLAVVPALLALVFLRVRVVTILTFLAACAVPLVAYATWFHSVHASFALTGAQGRFLYGRVVPFADCRGLSVPAEERALCPTQPVGSRPPVNDVLWGGAFSPFTRLPGPPGSERDALASDFSRRVILHQPLDYLRAVADDTVRAFALVRETAPGEYGDPPWEFQATYPTFFQGSICSPEARSDARRELPMIGDRIAVSQIMGCAARERTVAATLEEYGDSAAVDRSLASALRTYQRFAFVPGPLLGLGLLLGLAAAAGLGRARRSGLRAAAFLFSGLAVAVCLGSVAVTVFSWRYQIPQLVLLPPALALGATALCARGDASARVWSLRERASVSMGRRAGE